MLGALITLCLALVGLAKAAIAKIVTKRNGSGLGSGIRPPDQTAIAIQIGRMDANLERIATSQEAGNRHLQSIAETQVRIIELVKADTT
jgi:hypothetical protein